MRIFLSYGQLGDQVTALRLQALAVVNGLTVYVPPAFTRRDSVPILPVESASQIQIADVVLGVITFGFSASCQQELNAAVTLGKKMIVITEQHFAPILQPSFGQNLVIIDPSNPESAELAIVEHLKKVDFEESARKALLAIGTIALGLLIFAPQD